MLSHKMQVSSTNWFFHFHFVFYWTFWLLWCMSIYGSCKCWLRCI